MDSCCAIVRRHHTYTRQTSLCKKKSCLVLATTKFPRQMATQATKTRRQAEVSDYWDVFSLLHLHFLIVKRATNFRITKTDGHRGQHNVIAQRFLVQLAYISPQLHVSWCARLRTSHTLSRCVCFFPQRTENYLPCKRVERQRRCKI